MQKYDDLGVIAPTLQAGNRVPTGLGGFTSFGTNRVTLGLGSGSLPFFGGGDALVSTILGPSLQSVLGVLPNQQDIQDYFEAYQLPIFPNAPKPSILLGDNEGDPAVIQPPIRVAPPVSIRSDEPPKRPPVVVRPPVSSWPPAYC